MGGYGKLKGLLTKSSLAILVMNRPFNFSICMHVCKPQNVKTNPPLRDAGLTESGIKALLHHPMASCQHSPAGFVVPISCPHNFGGS